MKILCIICLSLLSLSVSAQRLESQVKYYELIQMGYRWMFIGKGNVNIGLDNAEWRAVSIESMAAFRAAEQVRILGAIRFSAAGYCGLSNRDFEMTFIEGLVVNNRQGCAWRILHKFQLEQRRMNYQPWGIVKSSSQMHYGAWFRRGINSQEYKKNTLYFDAKAFLYCNVKSEYSPSKFFQRAVAFVGVGYMPTDDFEIGINYNYQLGDKKHVFWGEMNNLSTLQLYFSHRLAFFSED